MIKEIELKNDDVKEVNEEKELSFDNKIKIVYCLSMMCFSIGFFLYSIISSILNLNFPFITVGIIHLIFVLCGISLGLIVIYLIELKNHIRILSENSKAFSELAKTLKNKE